MTLHTINIAGTDAPVPPHLRQPRGAWAKARDAEAAITGTRSPVVLFQARELIPGEDRCASEGDTKSILVGHKPIEIEMTEDGWCYSEEMDPLSVAELLEFGLAREMWRIECVLLSQADGARYGARHGHDYPNGWRVYTVPAEGDLEEMLAKGASWKGFDS